MRRLYRADGTQQDLAAPLSMAECKRLIGAETIDTVILRHLGQPLHVMLVDDNGWKCEAVEEGNVLRLMPVRALRPINDAATELYRLNCAPGTTHQIAGDVVVVPDEDFA